MTAPLLYDDPIFRAHDTGPGHPERPQRLDAIVSGMREAGLLDRFRAVGCRAATDAELARVHTRAHIARVAATEGRHVRFDADTQASPHSHEAARKAAGAVADAVERVLHGEALRAFCLTRPPGHHAEADRAMGFCLFNNVAVGAAAALARGLSRVLVLDIDVHHGNGTQHIFEDDPRVLYVSSHAFPFYPGTGALTEVGTGEGRGYTVNLPMPEGSGDAEYAAVYGGVVLPIARAFDPELVVVSAGFDAYAGDPLAGMALTAEGYRGLLQIALAAAAGSAEGRLVVALEGGYSLPGLSACGAAVAGELIHPGPVPKVIEAEPSAGWLPQLLAAHRAAQAPFWPALSASDPR